MKKGKEIRIKGVLSKHQRGFGFVTPDKDSGINDGDIFISPREMQGAMDQDLVEVRMLSFASNKGAGEGTIEKILKRGNKEVVGSLIVRGDHAYIIPAIGKRKENILVAKRNFNGADSGDNVVAAITKWPTGDRHAEGKVIEIISREGEALGDIKALIKAYKIRDKFPEKVRTQAESYPREVKPEDIAGRRDLRNCKIITIDGADAKDLDDAVSIERMDNGNYLLGVHIADVGHYVKEGSFIDKEALKRGTSVYLIDVVVPMLPKELSNGICSLFPKVDRLTLSVNMEINKKGEIVSHEIYKSLIRSMERMVYTDVSDMLENGDEALIKKFEGIYPDIKLMEELALVLRRSRKARGSLDFDIGESYITLNEDGIPIDIKEAERRIGNKIIEEFMLAANETIATHFAHLDLPFIYRVHEKPSPDKMVEFKGFLNSIGISIKGSPENIHPKSLNEILEKVRGTSKESVVNTVMLRSMKKASYLTDCLGHFGLGLKYYCHFTSPIRRYPDLAIHRIIAEFLGEGIYGDRVEALEQKNLTAADNSSLMERRAEELEREVDKLKKAQFMSYHIGEEFSGIISGMASFGFFVELANTVEGLVRIETIEDDYYIYEAEKYRFIGSRTGNIYNLGETITVLVDSVDIHTREINFVISDQT